MGGYCCRSRTEGAETQELDGGVRVQSGNYEMVNNIERYSPPDPDRTYVLRCKYDTNDRSSLSLEEREEVEVLDAEIRGSRVVVRSLRTGKSGLVPFAKLAKLGTIEAEPYYWDGLGKVQSELVLLSCPKGHGLFLIRTSESRPGELTLSVREDTPERDKVHHYRIERRDEKYILMKNRFNFITDLVSHFGRNADGLQINLRIPCKKENAITPEDVAKLEWEIDKKAIVVKKLVGGGNFGSVYKATWGSCTVAVKMLKEGSSEQFLWEAEHMKTLVHKNLVVLYGIVTKHEPVWIVTEFLENGDLLKYLNRDEIRKALDTDRQLDIGAQIAAGMGYLESQKIVHRDLAARNVLVGKNHEIKVADFGLAGVIKDDMPILAQIPTRWTAPEAISHNQWSSKSDVWSFGVVLWEIFTFGEKPFKDMETRTEIYEKVRRGTRLPQPEDCPPPLYELMLNGCWNKNSEIRPTFYFLHSALEDFLSFVEGGGYQETAESG